MPYIEQGERDFSFKFVAGTRREVLDKAPRLSAHFNRRPMVLSFYPTGVGEKPQAPVLLKDNDIVTLETLDVYKRQFISGARHMAEARFDITAVADLAEVNLQIFKVAVIGDRVLTKLDLLV